MQVSYSSKQQGAILFVCLIFLLVLTVLGASSMISSTRELRMANVAQDYAKAYEAAELGLKQAELAIGSWSLDSAPSASTDGTSGVWSTCGLGNDNWWETKDLTWFTTNATPLNNADLDHDGLAELSEVPHIVVERILDASDAACGGVGAAKVQQVSGQQEDQGSGLPQTIVAIYRVTSVGVGVNENMQVMLQSTYAKEIYK